MWLILAAVSFAAGLLYLLCCLRKLDHYLEKHPIEPEEDDNSGEPVV